MTTKRRVISLIFVIKCISKRFLLCFSEDFACASVCIEFRFINLFLSSKTSNPCGIIGVEYGIPKQGSHSTDKKSVGKKKSCVCEGGNVYV